MKSKVGFQRAALIAVTLFLIAGVLIIALDWKEMRQIIGEANWLLFAPSLLFVAVSYLCLSYCVAVVFRAFAVKENIGYLMRIGFVSTAVSYLMNVGGAAGVSLQFLLMRRRDIVVEDILAPSIFQLYISGLILVALLPLGLFDTLASHRLSPGGIATIGATAGVLTLLLLIATVIVFVAPARGAVLRGLSRVVQFCIRRDISKEMADFHSAMTRGVKFIRHQPSVLAMLVVLVIADWAGTVTALWFCFKALGNPIGIGTLLTGFSLGITAGFVSFVPGGLGVQEGSMAGVYALLGVPVRVALLAAILFRIVYYFIPFLVSVPFYQRLLRES